MTRHRLTQNLFMLLACGGVFVAGYQLTLRHALRQPERWSSALPWDAWVPFWPASIVAYLSINVAYALAFLLTREVRHLHQLAARIVVVQWLSFICFWIWPMHMERHWPPMDDAWSAWYQGLAAFDGPSNLLPSLHVAILGILWRHCRASLKTRTQRVALDVWALCVLVSALTTWQHHVLDVLAGALLSGAVIQAIRWHEPARQNDAPLGPHQIGSSSA